MSAKVSEKHREQTVSVEQAPQMFDPRNTNDCPAVLDETYHVEGEEL